MGLFTAIADFFTGNGAIRDRLERAGITDSDIQAQCIEAEKQKEIARQAEIARKQFGASIFGMPGMPGMPGMSGMPENNPMAAMTKMMPMMMQMMPMIMMMKMMGVDTSGMMEGMLAPLRQAMPGMTIPSPVESTPEAKTAKQTEDKTDTKKTDKPDAEKKDKTDKKTDKPDKDGWVKGETKDGTTTYTNTKKRQVKSVTEKGDKTITEIKDSNGNALSETHKGEEFQIQTNRIRGYTKANEFEYIYENNEIKQIKVGGFTYIAKVNADDDGIVFARKGSTDEYTLDEDHRILKLE